MSVSLPVGTSLPAGTDKISILLASIPSAVLDMSASDFKQVAANGNIPAHFHGRKSAANVHLHGGLTPDAIGRQVGRVEIKVRLVKNKKPNGAPVEYYSVNFYPTTERPSKQIVITYDGQRVVGGENWGSDENGTYVIAQPL
ncbi:MAG: hypothetical protein EBT21_03205 [Actinobacteria bacterium]|nr:hypothetical protein [Actinomycetota bacterium]